MNPLVVVFVILALLLLIAAGLKVVATHVSLGWLGVACAVAAASVYAHVWR